VPSQKQLRWSELRVGITVVLASITLAVLVFLMSGTSGFFSRKITLVTYFDNAEGLLEGAPVDLQGVQIGNVKKIEVVPSRPKTPVRIVMQVNTKYLPFVRVDTRATVLTAGVLGASYIDLDSTAASQRVVRDGDEIVPGNAPNLQDVVRATQSSLQNVDVLIQRLDRLVAQIESGNGTLAKIINDPTLINRANGILNQIQGMLNDVSNGKGTIGKLFADETLARKLTDSLDKLDAMLDETQSGKNNLGKVLKDETLYANLHQTVEKANKFMDSLNSDKGVVGELTKDQELAAKLKNTIAKLSDISDRLQAGDGSAGLFLKDPRFYNNTDQLVVETRSLIKAIRENPKKYLTIHFRIF